MQVCSHHHTSTPGRERFARRCETRPSFTCEPADSERTPAPCDWLENESFARQKYDVGQLFVDDSWARPISQQASASPDVTPYSTRHRGATTAPLCFLRRATRAEQLCEVARGVHVAAVCPPRPSRDRTPSFHSINLQHSLGELLSNIQPSQSRRRHHAAEAFLPETVG